MTLPHEPDDPKNNHLRNNSRKKTYAEAIQEANMLEARYGMGEEDYEAITNQEEDVAQQTLSAETQPKTEEERPEEAWEIRLTPELKK